MRFSHNFYSLARILVFHSPSALEQLGYDGDR
jgi:hypothetical protein